jgi:hypothetical protein
LDRTVAQGGVRGREIVSGDLVFAVARRDDDADLRALLRRNATGGWIRLALAREPDAFAAAAVMGPHHGYIVARHRGTREPVGMCEWSARESYIDGEPRLLAYLGALRVAPRYRHRLRVLRGGFEAVHRLLHDGLRSQGRATPYALTAIAAENREALRLLSANLSGLPRYHALESFSTFALRPRGAAMPARVERARADDLASIAVCLARAYRQYQFAPIWSARDLADPAGCPGLAPEDFLVVRRGPGIAGCVALWDQNAFKQTIVHGYAGALAQLRPIVNMAAPLWRMPRLPAAGEPLRQVYLSHLAVEGHDPLLFQALVDAALAEARRRGFALALTGLSSRHPLADVVRRRYRPHEYRTILHTVHWRGESAEADGPSSLLSQLRLPQIGLPHVEIAVL